MFWFILIILGAAVTIAAIALEFFIEDGFGKEDKSFGKFLATFFTWCFDLAAILAVVFALAAQDNYEAENRVLIDILKYDTQPKIEWTIHNGDTIQSDLYWLDPAKEVGGRFPHCRKDSLGFGSN